MVRVKICGITRSEDAALALKLGAWALGFIFYPQSPRYVTAERVAQVLKQLRTNGLTPQRSVGVFVNASEGEIRHVVATTGIDTIQLHGDEPPALLEALSDLKIFKAFRLHTHHDLAKIASYEGRAEAFLFDAAVPDAYGGTGQLSDWELLACIHSSTPLIVSGGLHASNVLAAIQRLNPFALDLSSGVEEQAGIKDPQKLQQLFRTLGGFHGFDA